MGTAILELKLVQELDSIGQDTPLLVFLDPQKAYNAVDLSRLLTTLGGHGSVPQTCKLLAVFLDRQEVTTFQNSYHGPHFKGTMGTTQGRLILSTLFNLIDGHYLFSVTVEIWKFTITLQLG